MLLHVRKFTFLVFCFTFQTLRCLLSGRHHDNITAFQILLSYGDSGLCGGAIIDQWWLITAAHCTVLKNEIVNIAMFEASSLLFGWCGAAFYLPDVQKNICSEVEPAINLTMVYNQLFFS